MSGGGAGADPGAPLLRREPGVATPLSVRQAAARAVRKSPPVDPLVLPTVAAALRRLPGRGPDSSRGEVAAAGECLVFARWRLEAR